MEQTSYDNVEISQENSETLNQNVIPAIHNTKNLEFENVCGMNDHEEAVADEFIFEQDEHDDTGEECFEDAIDEFLAQNVMDCIDESNAENEDSEFQQDSSETFIIDSEPRISGVLEVSNNGESDVNRQVQILLERQRK